MKAGAGRKVLVIDDEEHIILYLSTVLEDQGCEVISTTDPFEGLRLAREAKPDLICLDIMMPKKSGLSLYTELKRDARSGRIPVAIISGAGSIAFGFKPDFRKHLPDPGIPEPEAFFEKPVKVPDLIAFLSSLFGQRAPG